MRGGKWEEGREKTRKEQKGKKRGGEEKTVQTTSHTVVFTIRRSSSYRLPLYYLPTHYPLLILHKFHKQFFLFLIEGAL